MIPFWGQLFRLEGDGAYIFEGGKYTISKNGIVFFEADIPYLLIDEDSLYEDDLYAPFVNPLFDLNQGSAWLAAYEQCYSEGIFGSEFRSTILNSIEGSLANDLAFSSEAYIWTAYCTPEPATLMLLIKRKAGIRKPCLSLLLISIG
jgi:hypothetical protein